MTLSIEKQIEKKAQELRLKLKQLDLEILSLEVEKTSAIIANSKAITAYYNNDTLKYITTTPTITPTQVAAPIKPQVSVPVVQKTKEKLVSSKIYKDCDLKVRVVCKDNKISSMFYVYNNLASKDDRRKEIANDSKEYKEVESIFNKDNSKSLFASKVNSKQSNSISYTSKKHMYCADLAIGKNNQINRVANAVCLRDLTKLPDTIQDAINKPVKRTIVEIAPQPKTNNNSSINKSNFRIPEELHRFKISKSDYMFTRDPVLREKVDNLINMDNLKKSDVGRIAEIILGSKNTLHWANRYGDQMKHYDFTFNDMTIDLKAVSSERNRIQLHDKEYNEIPDFYVKYSLCLSDDREYFLMTYQGFISGQKAADYYKEFKKNDFDETDSLYRMRKRNGLSMDVLSNDCLSR